MNLSELIAAYKADENSGYSDLRYHTRVNQDGVLRRIIDRHGATALADINAPKIKAWHKEWSHNGQTIPVAHDFIKRLRTVIRFGATFIEEPQCLRLATVLSGLRFPAKGHKRNRGHVTAEQAIAIRVAAHARSWHSMGLGQAFQFEFGVRQKDAIGEYVPLAEPGETEYVFGHRKWLRGITWEEIDADLTLRHITSKKEKPIERKLRLAPMVMEELAFIACCEDPQTVTRDRLPATGPLLRNEFDRMPWSNNEYRRKWRMCANDAGLPKTLKNRHSRHGSLKEGEEAGVNIKHLRDFATHSDVAQTQQYLEEDQATEAMDNVQIARAAFRKRKAAGESAPVSANDNVLIEELRALLNKLTGGAA